jgi:menaquinone-dependent protoporphyrinogen oxidase
MNMIGVFYATREGHTKRIAEYVAAAFQRRGFEVDLRNVAADGVLDLNLYAGAVLAASVHAGRHEPEMVTFVKQHLAELGTLPAAFLSVTLSEAGAERATAPAEARARSAADVQKMIDAFVAETGWRPRRVKPVAGALAYRKYNFIIRLVMKKIAGKSGGETDTSRNYEYTDWAALDRFVEEFCADISQPTTQNVS